jgi:hypothetical protein
MASYFRSNQGFIVVTVAGVTLDSASWDSAEGGEATVASLYVLPGGMVPGVELGDIPKRSPMTVKRLWSDTLFGQFLALDAAAGSAAATVGYQLMAADRKTRVGNPITYSGVLGTVTRPGYDSETNVAAYLQIVVNLNEQITG